MGAGQAERFPVASHVTNLPWGAGVKAYTCVSPHPAGGKTIRNSTPEQLINTIPGREDCKELEPLCRVRQGSSMFHVTTDIPRKTGQDAIETL